MVMHLLTAVLVLNPAKENKTYFTHVFLKFILLCLNLDYVIIMKRLTALQDSSNDDVFACSYKNFNMYEKAYVRTDTGCNQWVAQ